MSWEPISPELALVDPELARRARVALPHPAPARWAPRPPVAAAPPPQPPRERPYPLWARITAALWLLVLGILIGGAAIPHAQDRPRVVPKNEDATICRPEPPAPAPSITPLGQP
jgi:hypothetical protein